jgi:hypothetical protein
LIMWISPPTPWVSVAKTRRRSRGARASATILCAVGTPTQARPIRLTGFARAPSGAAVRERCVSGCAGTGRCGADRATTSVRLTCRFRMAAHRSPPHGRPWPGLLIHWLWVRVPHGLPMDPRSGHNRPGVLGVSVGGTPTAGPLLARKAGDHDAPLVPTIPGVGPVDRPARRARHGRPPPNSSSRDLLSRLQRGHRGGEGTHRASPRAVTPDSRGAPPDAHDDLPLRW